VTPRFEAGENVRVARLDERWEEADRWVLGEVGEVHSWDPESAQWMVWVQHPYDAEPTLWMFGDGELEGV
jgi:hypothetical protein